MIMAANRATSLPARREVRLVVAGQPVQATEHAGATWLTAAQVAVALGFKSGQAGVMKLYRRHAGELRPYAREVLLDQSSSVAGVARVTCFAPGALAIFACVARTPKARAFRAAIAESVETGAAKRSRAVVDVDSVTGAEDVLLDAAARIEPLRDAARGEAKAALTGVLDAVDEQLTALDVLGRGGARAVAGMPERRQRVDGMAAFLRGFGGRP